MIGLLVAYSHLTNAQNEGEVSFSNIDTTPASINAASLNERLDKQDEQLQALKKENEVLKKQMKQIKTLFNANRRMIVLRTGSKQLITE